MIKFDLKYRRREVIGAFIVFFLLIGGISVFKYASLSAGFEITDDLGGNIFPSAILSVATTDAQVIVPSDSMYLGNPKSCIAVRVKSKTAYSRVRIEVAETPFFSRSVSEFVLNKPRTTYTVYPDIIWNYEALKNEVQAEPVEEVEAEEVPITEEATVEPDTDAVTLTEEIPVSADESVIEEVKIPEETTVTEEIPVSADESVIEEVPAQEASSSMADMSNPNKIMTPDEIAALIANL